MSSKASPAKPVTLDFKSERPLPEHVREIIEAHLAIEAEDARKAGSVGFMARAMVLASMPYKDPKSDVFTRENGDFRLRIVAGFDGGLPYGVYPRLLLSWVTTEAVRTKSREIELGDKLAVFLRDVMEIRSRSGGVRGASTRVVDQMARLFGAQVTARYSGSMSSRGFQLRNISVAEAMDVHPDDMAMFDDLERGAQAQDSCPPPAVVRLPEHEDDLWVPQKADEAGRWKSTVLLTPKFFTEAVNNPVPLDMRAFKALRGSVMAMDIYSWLTYRMAYTKRATRPIPWGALQMQFGSSLPIDDQGRRDFKKAFLRNLKLVLTVYPQARVDAQESGLVLLPSRSSVPALPRQKTLFDQPAAGEAAR